MTKFWMMPVRKNREIKIIYAETSDAAIEEDLVSGSGSLIRLRTLSAGKPKSPEEQHHALATGTFQLWLTGHTDWQPGEVVEISGLPLSGLRNYMVGGHDSIGTSAVGAVKVFEQCLFTSSEN